MNLDMDLTISERDSSAQAFQKLQATPALLVNIETLRLRGTFTTYDNVNQLRTLHACMNKVSWLSEQTPAQCSSLGDTRPCMLLVLACFEKWSQYPAENTRFRD